MSALKQTQHKKTIVFFMDMKAIYIFVFRLYWLDQSMIKSSTTNGSDIKSHITTSGARLAFVYKVIIL